MSAEGVRARYFPGGASNALLGTGYDLTPVNPGTLDGGLFCNQIPALDSKQTIKTKEIKITLGCHSSVRILSDLISRPSLLLNETILNLKMT